MNWIKQKVKKLEEYPRISLLLPIRNESAFIDVAMQAVLDQDYPLEKVDVYVIDGMSTDDTRQKISDFSGKYPRLHIIVLNNPDKIVPTGLNIALRQAKGEIVIRVDGHCIIAPNYIGKCVEHLRADGADGVGGPMETIGKTFVAKAIALGMSSPFGVGNSAFRTVSGKNMWTDSVPFPAYTRSIIERAGYYDEELVRNQDDEYNYRIRELGGRILLADDIHSSYFSRASWAGLWRQYFQYGFWKVRVLQKHPFQMSLRQFVPPAFVLALILSVSLALVSVFLPYSVLILLSLFVPLLYLLSNLFASAITAVKKGWEYFLLLPFVFAILHLSYGLGFLMGMVKFWDRWKDKIGKVPNFSDEPEG